MEIEILKLKASMEQGIKALRLANALLWYLAGEDGARVPVLVPHLWAPDAVPPIKVEVDHSRMNIVVRRG